MIRQLLLTAAALTFAAQSANATVEISSKPTQNMSCTGGICTPTARKAVLNVSELAAMLADGDTTIKSTSVDPDIEIDAALSWTSTSRLTLDSYRAIAFNKPVVVAGSGAMMITTNDGGSNGDFQFFGKGHVEFWDTTSSLVINGQTYALLNSIKSFARALRTGEGTGLHLAQPKDWHIAGHHTKSPLKEFNGAFEGLGNIISHLTINSGEPQVALFEALDLSGLVRDVTLTSIDMTGSAQGQFIGGLAGGSVGTIVNCHVSGSIVASQNSEVGGLLGGNGGTVLRSSAAVSITANDDTLYAGGLVGNNIDLGGDFPAVVQESYATGAVTGGLKVGGLIGESDGGTISNSYSTGAVTGSSSASVGGFLGLNALGQDFENTPTSITGSYSTGAGSGGEGAAVGGYIGTDTVQSGISKSYWDLDTSGVSDPSQGAGNIANDPGITGLTDAQLKSAPPAGFDTKVWKQKGSVNNGYPYLIANAPQ